MSTEYNKKQILENDKGWIFYDAAFKCWKSIFKNIEGDSVLDIGCGGGVSLSLIKVFNPFLHLVGLEGSNSGKDVWDLRGLDVKVGDIYKLPFKDKSFDTVYSSHVLEHCEEPKRVISETIRVASKRIIHIVPDGNVDEKNFGSRHIHKYNRINFLELFDNKSLKITFYESIQDTHMSSLVMVCDVTR